MLITQQNNAGKIKATITPTSNEKGLSPPILPERFNSIAQPSEIPILTLELNSISQPQMVKKAVIIG